MTFTRQLGFDVRCEWGLQGVAALQPGSDAAVIVDVLSFSTAVDIAVGRGAEVYPYGWGDERAAEYAEKVGAALASPQRATGVGYSLSPASLRRIPAGARLVLSSPNGATLSLATGSVPTFAGCLRNARAVAGAASKLGRGIALIAAGERWTDGSLRPSIEDIVGAGAIVTFLTGTRSPEAAAAEALFAHFRRDLLGCLLECASGRELRERGFTQDIEIAAEFNVSAAAPRLLDGAYRAEQRGI